MTKDSEQNGSTHS